ncbi:MAG: DUF4199 domain-containing protein [Cryomorphaceae bacterium]|nr:DUF4199 domain-containing protein [Cryomorphaceae bacterium]
MIFSVGLSGNLTAVINHKKQRMLSDINPFVKSEASRWGLTMAAVNVGFYLIAFFINRELFANFWATTFLLLFNLAIMTVAALMAKQKMEGFIEFKEAFSVSFLAGLISSILITFVVIIMFNFVDTNAAAEVQDIILERTIAMAERFGGSTDQLDEIATQITENNSFSTGSQVKGFFRGLILYAIISLIIAAFMKKTRPFHE